MAGCRILTYQSTVLGVLAPFNILLLRGRLLVSISQSRESRRLIPAEAPAVAGWRVYGSGPFALGAFTPNSARLLAGGVTLWRHCKQ